MKPIVALALLFAFASCTADRNRTAVSAPAAPSSAREQMESALIIGSAEVPDPVLSRVRDLEKDGVVKDVVVLESFPVQIRLSAPKNVIDELNALPRVGGIR